MTLAVTSKLNLAIIYLADGRLDARLAIAGREASAAAGHAGGNGSAAASGEEWQSGLFDKGSWVEAQAGWARTVITGGHRCFALPICAPAALICWQRLCNGDWTKRARCWVSIPARCPSPRSFSWQPFGLAQRFPLRIGSVPMACRPGEAGRHAGGRHRGGVCDGDAQRAGGPRNARLLRAYHPPGAPRPRIRLT